jgi:protein O-GlcNAc transferase
MPNKNIPISLSDGQINNVLTLYSNGEIQKTIKTIKALNKDYPNVPLLFNILGACYQSLGDLVGSIKMFKTAILIKPDYAEAYFNLGVVQKRAGQLEDAILSYKKTISLLPSYAEAHNNLGNILKLMGQADMATKYYISAIKAKPDFADAHNNLGISFKDNMSFDDAIKCFEKSLEINPSNYDACFNLANVWRDLQFRNKALQYYELASKINPSADYILGNVMFTKAHLCEWNRWTKDLKELADKINKNQKVIGPFALKAMIDDPELQLKATLIYVNDKFPKNDILPIIKNHPFHKKIRIGYFSADFRDHPVSTLTVELYERHERGEFEVHAFSYGPDTNDEMNLRIKDGVDFFHDVRSLSTKDIVLLSRSVELDIAIDLGGFTKHAKTDIFAMSAAPIQISYIGYLGSMGADYYDYLIADKFIIPKDCQKYYSEKIIYLPSFQSNDSRQSKPIKRFSRKELGLPINGFVFCCFNNTYKINPSVFDSWIRILNQVKDSVLMIFASNEYAQSNLTKEIAKRSIDASRIIFADHLSRQEYLERFLTMDLFLDTHPYNAGTTSSDALRMGLPVLTCLGNSFASRMGASILNAANIPELIASSSKEYESLAIELANNPQRMKTIKKNLANNLATSPLYDTSLFTQNLEAAFKVIYDRYHQEHDTDHIYVENSQ